MANSNNCACTDKENVCSLKVSEIDKIVNDIRLNLQNIGLDYSGVLDELEYLMGSEFDEFIHSDDCPFYDSSVERERINKILQGVAKLAIAAKGGIKNA